MVTTVLAESCLRTAASWLGLNIEYHLQVVREINVPVGLGRGRSAGHGRFDRLGFGPGRR